MTLNGPLALFFVFALLTIAGAITTITRRNPVVAVVSLVGTFFALAVEFLLLYAPFIAVIQVLVYAGAIMVLFVFVVMVLNREESAPLWRISGPVTKALAVVAMGMLFFRSYRVLAHAAPVPLEPPAADFGSVAQVGRLLLTDYLFPFEVVSILLLIAVVGALVIARQHHDKEKDAELAERRGA